MTRAHQTCPRFELVLASTSPRRRELLAGLGCKFRVMEPRFGELSLPKRLSAPDLAKALPLVALAKARDVARRCAPHELAIGADTVVHYRGMVLGKPKDVDDARSILQKLSNNLHRVFTAVAVVSQPGRFRVAVEETQVRFRRIDDEELERYLATEEPMDKAGAYGIQGLGGLFVANIKGRYDNVVGFPLATVYRLLREFEFDLLA